MTNVELALNLVDRADILAFDTETNGLDWKTCIPVGWALSDGKESVYVPTQHTGGGNILYPEAFTEQLAIAVSERTGPIIGHHLKFDMHMAANAGVMLARHRLSCTMNNQALIDEHTPSFSLDALTKYYKVTPKKKESIGQHIAETLGVPNDRHVMGHYHKLPGTDPLAVAYACDDALSTWEVYQQQLVQIGEQNLDAVWDLENRFMEVLYAMERKGIKIDEDQLGASVMEAEACIEDARAALPGGFNPNSGAQTRRYVENYRTDWPTTPKGNPSFESKWLKSFPEGRNVVALRQWIKVLTGFLIPLRDEHMFNGRVHTNFNQNKVDDYGTVSGRISSNNPNLLAVTKHEQGLAEVIRRVFVADDGYTMVERDYSQCEPCLFAHYSGDTRLLEGYRATPPRDVHTIVADLFNADRGTTAKRMNMGMFTGMSARTFASHMGMSLLEARQLWDKWNAMFPCIGVFQAQAKARMLKKGYVRTLLGRRARMDDRKFAYKATSRIIQGGNADIIKYKMVQVYDQFPECPMLLSAYDNLLFQTPNDRLDPGFYADLITGVMEDVQSEPFNLEVPIMVDGGEGKNWAEASL